MNLVCKELAEPHSSWLSRRMRLHLPGILQLAHDMQDSAAAGNGLPPEIAQRRDHVLYELGIKTFDSGAYKAWRFPYLCTDVCNALMRETEAWKFEPNEAEEAQVQMPEAVLEQVCPELDKSLKHLHDMVLAPLWLVLSGHNATEHQSCQVAQYVAGAQSCSDWHNDEDSECTSTVVLSPDDAYTGGGLCLYPDLEVGRGRQGDATLFMGRYALHKSLPITEGKRTLLVHWVNTN